MAKSCVVRLFNVRPYGAVKRLGSTIGGTVLSKRVRGDFRTTSTFVQTGTTRVNLRPIE